MVRPPDHLHDHAEAEARRERLDWLLDGVVGADADRLPCPLDDFVHPLRLLTFAGSHPHITDGHLLTPEEIVDTVLHGLLTPGRTPDAAPPPARPPRAVPSAGWPPSSSLQFVGVVAMLYLPSLNADIIDKGVAIGDTDYIVRTGAVMLAVSLLQIVCSVIAVAVRRPDGDVASVATCAPRLFHRVGSFSAARCSSSARRR